jgi:hypothetical protein
MCYNDCVLIFFEDLRMTTIVKQFRSFDNIAAVRDMYLRVDQRLAADFVVECERTDDAVLLSQLYRCASVFVNSMQAVESDVGVEWREFLHELISSVAEGANLGWYESSWQQIAFDRIGERVKFESIKLLILIGIREIIEVNRFASECKNIPAVGKMLPNITRDFVERDDATFNIVRWLALVEIYTRQYQGRDLYKQARYVQLVNHLAKYKNVKRDILFVEKLPLDKSNHKRYVSYFLKRVQNKDLHLAATFLCDNFNAVYEFYRLHDLDLICTHFRHALGLAAMTLKKEKEMIENKPRKLGDLMPKPSKRDDIDHQIDELNENIRQLNVEWKKMRDAAAKLRATIAKSKKLIADWEC